MNNRARECINDSTRELLPNGEFLKKPNFVNIQRFNSVGFSRIFVATAKIDGRNGIKAGDRVYFKANNQRGVNHLNRTDESMGSCEDLGEVFGYYMIRTLNERLGEKAVLKPTVYDFAEYKNDAFWKIIAEQTAKKVESDRLYGCITKNCLEDNAQIVHGHMLLGQIFDRNNCFRSSTNTLFNYEQGIMAFAEKIKSDGQEMVIDPVCTRYLANVMFWDYFYCNADRHCKNITFQLIPLGDGKFWFCPTPILDNGGGLGLQSINCEKMYREQMASINQNGKMVEYVGGIKNALDVPLDFYIGKGSFKNEDIAKNYDEMSYEEQLVMLLSQNRILFNDFKNMYTALDVDYAFGRMRSETRYNKDFLADFDIVAQSVINYKKEKFSKAIANVLGVEFDEELFNKNPLAYLNMLEGIVLEDELNLFIATDEQRFEFEARMKKLQEQHKQKQNGDDIC